MADPVASSPLLRRRRFARVTAWLGLVGLLIACSGIFVATRTVNTPLQKCGTAAGFLLDGRTSLWADPAHPPKGLTKAQVKDNNENLCQERAANQARPGAFLIAGGLALVLVAGSVEFMVRWRWLRVDARLMRHAGS